MKAKVPRNDGQQDKSNARTRKDAPAAQAAQLADSSARTSDQASLKESIQNSPRAAAQAAQLKTVFGEAAQLEVAQLDAAGFTGASATEDDAGGFTGTSATEDDTAGPTGMASSENDQANDNETENDAASYTGASSTDSEPTATEEPTTDNDAAGHTGSAG